MPRNLDTLLLPLPPLNHPPLSITIILFMADLCVSSAIGGGDDHRSRRLHFCTTVLLGWLSSSSAMIINPRELPLLFSPLPPGKKKQHYTLVVLVSLPLLCVFVHRSVWPAFILSSLASCLVREGKGAKLFTPQLLAAASSGACLPPVFVMQTGEDWQLFSFLLLLLPLTTPRIVWKLQWWWWCWGKLSSVYLFSEKDQKQ